MTAHPPIYLGTVLLENNRWGKGERVPSFRVSDWTQRFADDGFDGLELWENHALLADEEERERLRSGPCPVRIFNSYDVCEPETVENRRQIADLAVSLGAVGMKYNTGKEPDRHGIYVQELEAWRGMLPDGFQLLCECHRGSTLADVELANQTLNQLGREKYGMIIHGLDNEEETVRERFAAYGDRIVHIHGALSKSGLMSEQALCERLDLLAELGFQGSYTIEFTEGVRDGLTMEELYRNALRDVNLLRRCLMSRY